MTASPRRQDNEGVVPGTPSPSGAPHPASPVLFVDASGGEGVLRSAPRPRGESAPGAKLLVVGKAFASADLARVAACPGVEGRRGCVPEGDLDGGKEALVPALSAHVLPRPGAPTGARDAGGPSLRSGPGRAGRGMTPTTVSVNRVVTGAFGRAEVDNVTTGRPRTRRNY